MGTNLLLKEILVIMLVSTSKTCQSRTSSEEWLLETLRTIHLPNVKHSMLKLLFSTTLEKSMLVTSQCSIATRHISPASFPSCWKKSTDDQERYSKRTPN